MELGRERLVGMYRLMVRIRRFEEGVKKVYTEGLMPGLAHLYIGEEAVAVGVCEALREDDYITSTHRGHGHCIAKGGEVDRMMAEILGKSAGYCKGKGGSMHIADPDIGILGANGIVGGSLGIAAGAGLSSQLLGQDRVSVSFFGDGAANSGIFHEALNLASVWRLPVVYVCENNQYGMSVSQERAMVPTDVADRAAAYGIPGVTVDGNDVIAVWEGAREAVERARRGDGPTLLEYKTYRWGGHHVGDPGDAYRPREEVEEWRQRCPVARFRGWLIDQGQLTDEEAADIEAQEQRRIDDAIAFAKACDSPPQSELFTDVFAEPRPGGRT